MDRTKAAIIAAVAFAAGAGSATVAGRPTEPTREVVNMRVIKASSLDGGARWYGRACANETIESITTERCWEHADVPIPAVAPLEAAFLDQK